MSETVRSYGHIAVLVTPLDKDKRDEVNERLCDGNSILRVNYQGTLLYSDHNANANYDTRTNVYGLFLGSPKLGQTTAEFYAAALKEGLTVDPITTKPYNCIWYNGVDSDMDTLTVEMFRGHTD